MTRFYSRGLLVMSAIALALLSTYAAYRAREEWRSPSEFSILAALHTSYTALRNSHSGNQPLEIRLPDLITMMPAREKEALVKQLSSLVFFSYTHDNNERESGSIVFASLLRDGKIFSVHRDGTISVNKVEEKILPKK